MSGVNRMERKLKIIYVGLGISIFMIIFLSVKIDTRKPVCERPHVDDIDKSASCIPMRIWQKNWQI